MTDPVALVVERLTARRCIAPRTKKGYYLCPAHADRVASLHVSAGAGGRALIHCQAGCAPEDILRALDLRMPDLFPHGRLATPRTPIAIYRYEDEEGVLLYKRLRFEPKAFRLVRADGYTGPGCMTGVRRVLYRLPRVLDAARRGDTIWVTEGEKAADALADLGLAATCGGGAGSWRPDFAEAFTGAQRVVCVADRDTAGRAYAAMVVESVVRLGLSAHRETEETGAHDNRISS
ncbi:MAG: hypothetical protein M3Q31_05720 [Actinomycetota bacterium]|nr:hypothetical protein [Actinomycetota bacterium]